MSLDHDLDQRVFLAFLKQLSSVMFSSIEGASMQALENLASTYFAPGLTFSGVERVVDVFV
jgi:hypothetical protein